MKKMILCTVLILSWNMVFSQSKEVPKVLKLDWGLNVREVQRVNANNNSTLSPLKYYQTIAGRDELSELRGGSQIRYIAQGKPFMDVPSDVIFTFYNGNNTIDGLKLAKVEVYLKKKHSDKTWINTKSVFKSLISFFCDNYQITLSTDEENIIFTRYDYEVIVNGVYVNFVADLGNNRLSSDDAIYFTYESNNLKTMILKKDIEIEREKMKINENTHSRDPNAKIKGNL